MKVPLEGQKIYLHQNKKVNKKLYVLNTQELVASFMQTNRLTTNMQKAMYSKYLFAVENQTLKLTVALYPWNPNVNISGSDGQGQWVRSTRSNLTRKAGPT